MLIKLIMITTNIIFLLYIMGVNPSNRRLRASNNLTKYGAEGNARTGGGFGVGNKGGIGFGIMRFRSVSYTHLTLPTKRIV